MALDKNDLFLVVRDGASHRITAGEMKAHFGGTFGSIRQPEVLTPPNNEEISLHLDKLTGEPYPITEDDWTNRRELRFTSSQLEYDGDPVTYAYRTWIIQKSDQPYINLPNYEPWEDLIVENDISGPETRDEGWDPGDWWFAKGTHYRVNVRYVGSDSEVSPASEWNYFYTDPEIPDEPDDPEPAAILHGLRFDDLRKTKLENPSVLGSGNFTISLWVKPTKTDGERGVFTTTSRYSGDGLRIKHDGDKLTIANAAALSQISGAVKKNQWSHYVVKYNGSKMIPFVNGKQMGGPSVSGLISDVIAIGKVNNSANDEKHFDGYMSDIYFIDGSAEDPTLFGQFLSNGEWGPRNPDDIKDDIALIEQVIPPGENWNTSATWSKNVTTNGSYESNSGNGSPGAAFDGDDNTRCVTTDASSYLLVTFNPPLSGEIKIMSGDGRYYSVNGTSVPVTGTGFIYRSLGTHTNVTSIKVDSGPGLPASIHGIKLNDENLVDKADGFGPNGFYLPFDPDAVGNIYSGKWSGSVDSFNGPTAAFDGDLTTYTRADVSNNCTFNHPGIPYTSLRIMGCLDNNAGATIHVNGVDVSSAFPQNINLTWANLSSFSGLSSPITSIKLTSNSVAQSRISAIEVNGRLLIDGNNISVDDSGNNNNFTDKNFAVGDTSKHWSKNATPDSAGFQRSPSLGFDGNLDSNASTNSSSSSAFIKLSGLGISGSSNIQVLVHTTGFVGSNVISGPNIQNLSVSGSAAGSFQTLTVQNTSNPVDEITISSDSSARAHIGAIKVDGILLIDPHQQDTVRDNPVTDYAVLVNASGSAMFNGALASKSAAGSGVIGAPSGRFYFEGTGLAPSGDASGNQVGVCKANDYSQDYATYYGDGEFNSSDTSKGPFASPYSPGDIIGVAVDMNAKTVNFFKNGAHQGEKPLPAASNNSSGLISKNTSGNFGQQPFVASNVTENLDEDGRFDGTVTLSAPPSYKDDWASMLTSIPPNPENTELGFDGDLTTYAVTPAGYMTSPPASLIFTPQPPIEVTSSLRLNIYDYCGVPAYVSQKYKVNGGAAQEYMCSADADGWIDLGFTGTLTSIEIIGEKISTAQGRVELAAVEVDGNILLQGSSGGGGVGPWVANSSQSPAAVVGTLATIFDGNQGTYYGTNSLSNAPVVTFDPPLGDGSSDIEIYVSLVVDAKMQINGGSVYDASNTSDESWHKISEKTISTLKLYDGDLGQAAYITAIKVGGDILIDGQDVSGVYNTLHNRLPDYMRSGDLFYSEKLADTIHYTQLKGYGVTPSNCHEVGIYPLSEQPKYATISYVRKGNEYCPVYDYTSILANLNIELDKCINALSN